LVCYGLELGANIAGQGDRLGGAGGCEEESTSGVSTSDSVYRSMTAVVQRFDSVDNRDLHMQIQEVEEENRRSAKHSLPVIILTK
jgi:hypothetical protein